MLCGPPPSVPPFLRSSAARVVNEGLGFFVGKCLPAIWEAHRRLSGQSPSQLRATARRPAQPTIERIRRSRFLAPPLSARSAPAQHRLA